MVISSPHVASHSGQVRWWTARSALGLGPLGDRSRSSVPRWLRHGASIPHGRRGPEPTTDAVESRHAGHPDRLPAYPARWVADVALADGGTVHVRPVRPRTAPLVEAFHDRQSRESIYFRYFSPMPRLSARELDRLTKVDYLDHLSLRRPARRRDHRHGRLRPVDAAATRPRWPSSPTTQHHGRGLATVLLEWLVVAAREVGFRALTAQVLPTNRGMLAVFHQVGFEATSTFTDGVVEVR